MRDIWSYGVKYPYGYSEAYGSKFHIGEDWTVTDGRRDIPVTVNGTTIGIAGTTGDSTGIHTHVGRYVGGKHTPPQGQGASLSSPVVLDTGYDASNGNYVRIQDSSGVVWVYLHLSQINVVKGQAIGGDMSQTDIDNLYKILDQTNKNLDALYTIVNNNDTALSKKIDELFKLLNETNKRLDVLEGK